MVRPKNNQRIGGRAMERTVLRQRFAVPLSQDDRQLLRSEEVSAACIAWKAYAYEEAIGTTAASLSMCLQSTRTADSTSEAGAQPKQLGV